VTAIWIGVLATAVGCYALKLAGLTVPPRVLASPRARRFASLVPVALLAGLTAVEVFGRGQAVAIDPARLAGLGAAVLALTARAPFLVVILAAASTTAGLRALGVG
jgi:branched-subunit amino acid transport protein